MPKHILDVTAGRPLPTELRTKLSSFFDRKTLDRLERLGGRITISLAAPYSDRRNASRSIEIGNDFRDLLRQHRSDRQFLEEKLSGLSKKQLTRLGHLLDQPLRPSATAAQLRADLLKNIQAEHVWNQISKPSNSESS